MNTSELTAALERVATANGVAAPSQSKVESWIHKRLVSKSVASGGGRGKAPIWRLPENAELAARKILELEGQGAVRASQLRIGLSLSGFEIPFDDFRHALAQEARRDAQRLRRRDLPPLQEIGAEQLKKNRARFGPLDPEFDAAGYRIPDSAFASIGEMAIAGNLEDEQSRDTIWSSFEVFLPGLAMAAGDVNLVGLFAGLIGLRDEVDSSNEDLILSSQTQAIVAVRDAFIETIPVLDQLITSLERSSEEQSAEFRAIAKTVRSIQHISWMPSILAIGLRLHRSNPEWFEPELRALALEIIQSFGLHKAVLAAFRFRADDP